MLIIMARFGELDWTELTKTGIVEQDPLVKAQIAALNLSKWDKETPTPILKKGEIPRKPTNEEIAKAILSNIGGAAQWKDADHLNREVVSQEEAEALEKAWHDSINGVQKASQAKIGKPVDDDSWGSGKSFNSTLTPEELVKRNMCTDGEE